MTDTSVVDQLVAALREIILEERYDTDPSMIARNTLDNLGIEHEYSENT